MKVSGGKNCQRQVRNLPGDGILSLRIEYKKPTITVLVWDVEKKTFDTCLSLDHELEFSGNWVVAAGNGIKNPDHVYIENFVLYDPETKVAEGHNKHVEEVHKKKAYRFDTSYFDHKDHVKDLIHSDASFFRKEQFGEENLLDMIPH